MSNIEEEVRRRLFELQDLKYKEFACKLMPTVNPVKHGRMELRIRTK